MSDTLLLSLITFVPTVGAILLMLVPGRMEREIKIIALVATLVTFGLTLVMLGDYMGLLASSGGELGARAAAALDNKAAGKSNEPGDLVFRYQWIEVFHVEYYMGVDGINAPLVVLTGLVCLLGMIASWNIAKHIRGYCILYLLLETGMMGTFLSLDFFLFYVFWEVMLLPMYFLIGVWGAPSRTEPDGRVRGGPYAAIKFFLYTLAGSVLLLIAMLGFYFHPAPQTAEERVLTLSAVGGNEPGAAASPAITVVRTAPAHSFDIMKIQDWAMRHREVYGIGFQLLMFGMLYVGFAIKVPVFPFHTWLPDAHVEAPTPISMILAGVLLKMGGYGFVRIAYPMCPEAAAYLAWPLVLIGVWNIIYGALAAMAQTDFKKLVAYSSVSHMGYVILGFAVWSTAPGFNPSVWSTGFNGAMFQMIAHGISSPAMFFVVGVIYDRVHHRDLNRFGGLATMMPVYGGLSAGIFFAGLGLPGMCGFIGEVMTVLATWQFSKTLAVIAALGVILTAGYILWTMQRVFLGTHPSQLAHDHGHGGGHDHGRGGHSHGASGHELYDITAREMLCAVPLLVLCVLLGVYPNLVFSFMEPSVTALVLELNRTVTSVAGSMPIWR
jgi:NADH-quinone oxidoreductase subunit M